MQRFNSYKAVHHVTDVVDHLNVGDAQLGLKYEFTQPAKETLHSRNAGGRFV